MRNVSPWQLCELARRGEAAWRERERERETQEGDTRTVRWCSCSWRALRLLRDHKEKWQALERSLEWHKARSRTGTNNWVKGANRCEDPLFPMSDTPSDRIDLCTRCAASVSQSALGLTRETRVSDRHSHLRSAVPPGQDGDQCRRTRDDGSGLGSRTTVHQEKEEGLQGSPPGTGKVETSRVGWRYGLDGWMDGWSVVVWLDAHSWGLARRRRRMDGCGCLKVA